MRRLKLPMEITAFAALIVCWQLGVWLFHPRPIILPGPSAVFEEIAAQPMFYFENSVQTVLNTLWAFALATVIGIATAVAIAHLPILESTLYAALVAFNNVPKVALAPLFVIWLGTGNSSKVAMAFMVSILSVVIAAMLGFRSIHPEMTDLGRSFHASPLKILLKIRLPQALPSIFAGLKLAISLSLVGAIVGEFVAAQRGLGYVILAAMGAFSIERVFAAVLLLAIIGTALYYAVEFAERLVIPWHESHRHRLQRSWSLPGH
jgi:NitT/TauT family transport system permease protein